MFLSKDEYLSLIKESKIVENYSEENAQTISYDLRIDYILGNNDKYEKLEYFSLEPGATVFIASIEKLKFLRICFLGYKALFKYKERYCF